MRVERVLVTALDGVGALIEAEPAFAAVRRAHRAARIDVVTRPALASLLARSPHFDRVVEVRAEGGDPSAAAVGRLRAAGYDRAYALDGTRVTAALRRHLAAADWVGPSADADLQDRPFRGPAIRKVLFEAGISPMHRLPDPSFGAADRAAAEARLLSSLGIRGRFALLLKDGAASGWPPRCWTELARAVAERGVRPVTVGYEGDTRGPGGTDEPGGSLDLAGIALLAAQASFFVSDGADAVHLALAASCPGVLIGDGRDAWQEAAFGRDVVRLLASPVRPVSAGFAADVLTSMGLLASPAERAHRLA